MELTVLIESAEKELIQILERFFVSVYDEKKLPSHGLDHHRRVWKNARNLLLNLPDHSVINPRLPFTLIISSYLHDLGMAIDHGPKHGSQSMVLCRKFMRDNHLEEHDFPGLMDAIREHDNKSYPSSNGINALSLLAVADDLDAFGFIGIYRYTEIYMLRGMDLQSLGKEVRKNASGRFEHFKKLFENSPVLFGEHEKRYRVLDSFFAEYDKEVNSDKLQNDAKYHLNLVLLLLSLIEKRKDIFNYTAAGQNDPVAEWFFSGLAAERSGIL